MKKRIISLTLTLALLCGLVIASTASASSPATLYTGGGSIYATDWQQSGSGKYTGTGNLPAPVMPGAAFEGWYTDVGLSEGAAQAGSEAVEGVSYYAKWTLVSAATGSKMECKTTAYGATANGLKAGEYVSAFFTNGGFFTAYNSSVPASGGTDSYGGSIAGLYPGELYANVSGTDVYIGRTASLEGSFVRFTYYVQNRGSASSAAFWLGAAADAQLGGNDHVPLRNHTNKNGYSYLAMEDSAASNELRLYYTGPSLSTPDRLWWGGYWASSNKNSGSFIKNTFNDGKDANYADGIDSAFALSWNVPSIGAGETVSYSFLLGVGTPTSFNTSSKVTYSLNGGTGTAPADSNSYPIGAEVTLASTAPTRSGYTFLCWSTAPDGSGSSAAPGGKLRMYGDTTLYAIWTPIAYSTALTVKQDSDNLSGKTVTLWQNGRLKYTLTESGSTGVYENNLYSGVYDVYVDGVRHSESVTVSGVTTADVQFYSAAVPLTKDGDPWPGHSVSLHDSEGNKLYDLSFVDGTYTAELVAAGSYSVYLDGKDTGETLTTGTPLNLAYHTAEIPLTKDGKVWADAAVTVGDYEAALSGGKYTVVVPAGEYEVKLGSEAIGTVGENGYTLTNADYFTVTFYDDTSAYASDSVLPPQIVRSGEAIATPATPTRGESVFSSWTKDGAAFEVTTPITGTTALAASWSTPVVTLGTPTDIAGSTYKFGDLTITGYGAQSITGFTVTITDGSTGDKVTDSGTDSTAFGSGTKSLSVTFDAAKSISDAAAYLRALTYTIGSATHTVDITVFATAE